jgi:peptidoglycan/xylan/chitin deacetylase (PgdA/CDA1 family)
MPGALVISLDFELHWGVRDRHDLSSPYVEALLGARAAIPRILSLFRRFDIHATWATVGMLACDGRPEWMAFRPEPLPGYLDSRLSPYAESVGIDEDDDPLHFAPSLVREIAGTAGQELGSHTFSHYYCLEPGQSQGAFVADLRAVRAIHQSLAMPPPRAIVLPRNQVNAAYLGALLDAGFGVFRGNQSAWMYRRGDGPTVGQRHRAGRLLDAYIPLTGHHLTAWEDVPLPNGLCNVPASLFLRPCADADSAATRLRERRITQALGAAARREEIFHLWWHPHNFGLATDANLLSLERLLVAFSHLRDNDGMLSASMSEIAQMATRA